MIIIYNYYIIINNNIMYYNILYYIVSYYINIFIIKEIEQNRLTWFGHVTKNGRRKTDQNSTEVDGKTKESTRKTEEKLDGRNKEGHERKKPK